MKLIHIAGIIVLGVGIALIALMYNNTSQYVSFEGAEKLAIENPNKNYHIVAELNRDKPMKYDPQKDPNHFEFYAFDSLGIERLVVFGDAKPADFEAKNYKKMAFQISEKGLRYDLTVPFARYVVMHRNDIAFPFKRYQIQPVWRADRPQKGRYREFYQCDADVVGSDALIHEVELIQIFDEVLSGLKLDDFTVKINNRKILSGLVEVMGESDQLIQIIELYELNKIDDEGYSGRVIIILVFTLFWVPIYLWNIIFPEK